MADAYVVDTGVFLRWFVEGGQGRDRSAGGGRPDGASSSGRPGTRRQYHNMKELRPPSSGTSEIRMLFCFDPAREAIFLVAGDKAGNWNRWYREAIPLADERFAQHLIMLKQEEQEER